MGWTPPAVLRASSCQLASCGAGVSATDQKESAMHATSVAVDLAKNIFELAVTDAHWHVVERWIANRAASRVVMPPPCWPPPAAPSFATIGTTMAQIPCRHGTPRSHLRCRICDGRHPPNCHQSRSNLLLATRTSIMHRDCAAAQRLCGDKIESSRAGQPTLVQGRTVAGDPGMDEEHVLVDQIQPI